MVTAGLAEVAAGSIAMGLGGYLAARSDAEHYASELLREEREIVEVPDVEGKEVAEILESYGVEAADAATVVARAFHFHRRHAPRAVHIWICERTIHRSRSRPQRAADDSDRRVGGWGRLRHRASDIIRGTVVG